MKKIFLTSLVLLISSLSNKAIADDAFCQSLYDQQSALAEPAECENFRPAGSQTNSAVPSAPSAVTDTTTFFDIGFVSTNFGTHPMGDLSNQTVLNAALGETYFGMEYDQSLTNLYALDNNTANLVIISPADGTITSVVGPLTNLVAGETAEGITIDNNGVCYVNSTDGVQSTLYTCDLTTGTLTVLGSQSTTPLLINIAASCDGTVYGHDITTDSIFTFNTTDGSATLIGPTGIDANFAQGLAFDREAGVLYGYLYQGGGANTYASLDLVTGSATVLNVDSPQGEFTGASQTTCASIMLPPPVAVPAFSIWSILALLILVSCSAFVWRMKKA